MHLPNSNNKKSALYFNKINNTYDTEADVLVELKQYPGYYITDLGEVFNIKTKRKLKIQYYSTNHNNYKRCRVNLCINGKVIQLYLHKLVALAFLPTPTTNPDGTKLEGPLEVDHKDFNTANNTVDNLQWCDKKYNASHRSNCKKNPNYMCSLF